MSYVFCEVCKHRVYESKWDIHVEGEEHQRNVSKEKGQYWNGEVLHCELPDQLDIQEVPR